MSQPRGRVRIDQFTGRVSNASPHAIGNGAVEMDNILAAVPGELRVRKGCRVITITNAAATAASDVIAMASISRPEYRAVLYQTASGDIRIAKGPA